MSDVIDSNETTEAELEDAGDAAGALAPQVTMCGAIEYSGGLEGEPKIKLAVSYYSKLNADHVSLRHRNNRSTIDANDTWTCLRYCLERKARSGSATQSRLQ